VHPSLESYLLPRTSPLHHPSTTVVPSPDAMANHLELIQELQQLDKVPSLERLRAAQKRRTQQLKRWAVYEKEMQNKKRKADKKGRNAKDLHLESKRHVSFAASVALLEASARNDPDEGRASKEYLRDVHLENGSEDLRGNVLCVVNTINYTSALYTCDQCTHII